MSLRFSSSAAVDFHVVNSLGVSLYTSPDRDLAKAEARKKAKIFGGVEVIEVTVTTIRRRVYKPAPPKAVERLDASMEARAA